ncbi:hypothetical protein PV08_05701 [Exophiala spinifera]|uniref:Uncharacterized protein n=1 Tax=Exophiala spinifera TaxID=91928 RepID=A0A0D1ZS71_9EURO|nr:uncharacterized protein PV08_05701 [Exophiala spinifera]KIW15652.1 hypothetical protein PV08_05701 [Exophiala spinifera]
MPPPNEHQILTSYLLHPSPLPTILPYTSFQSLFPSATSRTHTDLKPFYRHLQSQRDSTLDDIRRRIREECRSSTSLAARLARQIRREEQSEKPTSRKRKRSAPRRRRRDDASDAAAAAAASSSSPSSDPESEDARVMKSDADDDDSDTDAAAETTDQVEQDLDARLHGPHGSTLPSTTARQNHGATSLLDAMKKAGSELEDEIASLEAQIAAARAQCEDRIGNLSDLRYGRFAQSRVGGQDGGDGHDGTATSRQQEQQQQGIEKDVVDALADFRARLQTV